MNSTLLKFYKILILISVCLIFVFSVSAQTIEGCAYIDEMRPENRPLTPRVRQRMIELCIEANKKDFEELLDNSEEVAKLSKELEDSFNKNNNQFSSVDQKKLKKVEKLLKDIRKELRANDDDDDDDEKDKRPTNTLQAIKDLQEKTKNLLDEVNKTTRHTISTAAIQSSNAVLRLVKFLRFGN